MPIRTLRKTLPVKLLFVFLNWSAVEAHHNDRDPVYGYTQWLATTATIHFSVATASAARLEFLPRVVAHKAAKKDWSD